MESLVTLFPRDDFTLLAVILGLPLVGAFVNGVFGKRIGKEAVTLMALSAVAIPFVISAVAFCLLVQTQTDDSPVRFVWTAWEWLSLSLPREAGQISVNVAFSVDALSGTMALIVTGVGFLIHLYSTKYMGEDPGYARFFCYMNLFIFSMLVLILGNNLPMLFIGWEGVGLCSYLLIGFWYEHGPNAAAGKKAFITNRIGDFGLLVAMGLLVYYAGSLDWSSLDSSRSALLTPVKIWPLGPRVPAADYLPGTWAAAVNTPYYVNAATVIGLSLFLGCVGKSAQIPLYVWLPDAMAGPTPVSALIHAATMVTAGVYLVCRMAAVFVLSPAAMLTIALIGAATAFFAATIALLQNDIKKVLAYSTVSQLGYMFLGVGVGAFSAGFFHLLTHAFFKACLFLGAGSVIHAMHARIHDTDASQDMRNMGGLKRYLPHTFLTFAFAWAAIVGFPGTSGFFSKDEILLKAQTSFVKLPIAGGVLRSGVREAKLIAWPDWAPGVLYALGAAAAVMTAFYMTRLVVGIFYGKFSGWKIVKRYRPADDEHGHHDEAPGEPMKGPVPHESPWQMTAPLWILGGLSLVGGFLNAHLFHLTPLEHFLEPVFARAAPQVELLEGHESAVMPSIGIAVLCFLAGAGLAYWMYVQKQGEPGRQLAKRFRGLYRLVYDKWRIDELYEETVIGAVDSLAEFCAWADRYIVDGILARATSFTVMALGTLLRYLQVGRVQAYATLVALGLLGLGWFFTAPRAEAQQKLNHASGQYSLTAAPGLGYSYRWDADGDGKWDTKDFGSERQSSFSLNVDQSRTVRLEVKNAFGRVKVKSFSIARPKPDRSGPGPTTLNVERGPDGKLLGRPGGEP